MLIRIENGLRWFNDRLIQCLRVGRNVEAISIIDSARQRPINKLKDYQKRTLLHYAVNYNNYVVAEHLIKIGCDLEARDTYGDSPLMMALKLGNVDTISVLIQAKKGHFNIDRYIELAKNSYPSDMPVVKILLEKVTKGCYNNEQRAERLVRFNCPLAAAVWIFRNTELTKLMLDRGSSIHGRLLSTGETALHLAVEYLDIDNVKLLIEHGAGIDAKDSKFCTPLSRFLMGPDDPEEKLEILRLLLDRGASLTTYFSSRRDSHWLYYYDAPASLTVLKKLLLKADSRTIQVLIPYIDLFRKDKDGYTPLHHLANNRNPGVLQVLKGKKYNINARDPEGWTPLDVAVCRKDVDKVRFLLENGADPNNIDKLGYPALRHLQNVMPYSKDAQTVFELLLLYDADLLLSTSTNENCTLLFSAMQKDFEYAKLALAHLAKLESAGISLHELIVEKIKSRRNFKDYFGLCKQQLKRMKVITVYESITLYKLLCENQTTLIKYARNEEFRLNYVSLKNNRYHLYPYYVKSLTLRVDKAIISAILKNDAAYMVARIIGLPISMIHTIADKVVDYLNEEDLRNLSQL